MSARRPSLPRLLKRCQDLLGLGDWQISANWATAAQIKREIGREAYACNVYDRNYRTSKILLLDPTTHRAKGDVIKYRPRFFMLHELIHLIVEYPDDEMREEQAVNQLAAAYDRLL